MSGNVVTLVNARESYVVKTGKTNTTTNTWGKTKTDKDKKVENKRITVKLLSLVSLNKTISDGGITVDFWFIKVHTSN